jgi:hypothetical protein
VYDCMFYVVVDDTKSHYYIRALMAHLIFTCLFLFMFQRILNSISGDYNQRHINKLLPIVAKTNERDAQFDTLSDDEIKAKTPEFQARLRA